MEITMNYGRLGLDVTPVLWQVKDKGFFQSAFEFDWKKLKEVNGRNTHVTL